MAKEVAGLIKLQIKGGAQIHHLPLDLLWVLRVLISWNFASNSTPEPRTRQVKYCL
jgi:hypothetical protein